MIVVRLMGGMGNQMFQYAAATALAAKHGTVVKIDTSWLEGDPLRDYSLHYFDIDELFVSKAEREYYCPSTRLSFSYFRGLIRRMSGKALFWADYGNDYNPEFDSLDDDIMINGRFQSEKYFCNIRNKIRSIYNITAQPDDYTLEVIDKIKEGKSVCLHVRRSDYVFDSRYSRSLGPLPMGYYYNALDMLGEVIGDDAKYFVFSDDVNWCRGIFAKELKKTKGLRASVLNGFSRDIDCFRAMGSCDHFVISNSTYAWWAAWLGDCDNKVVVAPKNWSNDGSLDSVDRIPDSWMVV